MTTTNLENAIVYDVETLVNAFTFSCVGLFSDFEATFEISQFRDDRTALLAWFDYWHAEQVPMVGFNVLGFDYPIIHQLYMSPDWSYQEFYEHAQRIISSGDRFGHQIWESDRFAPQIDLYKIHHFDNPAKATSLKALQINMRSETVVEMPLPWDKPVSEEQLRNIVIPYNKHDVLRTKDFALHSMDAIKFRIGLKETIRGDVLNFNDTKIGAKLLEERLGEDVCYYRDETGRRRPLQTPRKSIALNDIIFPYIEFRNPEFQRVLSWMRTQTLSADEFSERIKTKGVFNSLHASVGGIEFHFGTGGIHGSIDSALIASDDQWMIEDIDVAALYPSIAIVNGLYPEHLGKHFVEEYAKLPIERSKHKKGTVQNAAFKLASNGTYGNSNNEYSVFFDPKFTMTITINGQLMLCMLAEWLLTVDTLRIIQINTDGVTYLVRRDKAPHAHVVQAIWERLTKLVLERVEYSRMWIRDVNNYVAQKTNGDLKLKGAYWYPEKFPEDIINSSPPAWHKDFSAIVVTKAAVEHMVHGTDIAQFVCGHADPFEFMLRAKVDNSCKLFIGDQEVQRTTRYYVANSGGYMRVIRPAAGPIGEYKRRNRISDPEWHRIRTEIGPGVWDARIHTKNKSTYEQREQSIQSGYVVAECNNAATFDFSNVNYQWYIEQAKRLVIS